MATYGPVYFTTPGIDDGDSYGVWSNAGNANANDSSYATATTVSNFSNDVVFPMSDFTLQDNATISNIVVELNWKTSASSANTILGVEFWDGNVAATSNIVSAVQTTTHAVTNNTFETDTLIGAGRVVQDWTLPSVYWATLKTLYLGVYAQNAVTSVTITLNFVRVTLTYTVPASDAYGSSPVVGSLSMMGMGI